MRMTNLWKIKFEIRMQEPSLHNVWDRINEMNLLLDGVQIEHLKGYDLDGKEEENQETQEKEDK